MIKSVILRFARTCFGFFLAGPISEYIGGLNNEPVLKFSLTGAAILSLGKALRAWMWDTKYEKFMNFIPF